MVTQGMNYIYAVYQKRSFSKSARLLFISQPALSASVRRTEEQLGFPIFDRSCKPLSLTPDGEAYIQTIKKILSPENDTGARARETLEQAGISPHVFLTLNQQMAGYNITLNGLAIAFVSNTLIRQVPLHENVIYYRLQMSGKPRQVCFYWKHQRYRTSAMDAFLSGIKKEVL